MDRSESAPTLPPEEQPQVYVDELLRRPDIIADTVPYRNEHVKPGANHSYSGEGTSITVKKLLTDPQRQDVRNLHDKSVAEAWKRGVPDANTTSDSLAIIEENDAQRENQALKTVVLKPPQAAARRRIGGFIMDTGALDSDNGGASRPKSEALATDGTAIKEIPEPDPVALEEFYAITDAEMTRKQRERALRNLSIEVAAVRALRRGSINRGGARL